MRISGQSRPASAGEISSISTPKLRARATVRLSSTTRAGVLATLTLPQAFQPVAWPVSASSVR